MGVRGERDRDTQATPVAIGIAPRTRDPTGDGAAAPCGERVAGAYS